MIQQIEKSTQSYAVYLTAYMTNANRSRPTVSCKNAVEQTDVDPIASKEYGPH